MHTIIKDVNDYVKEKVTLYAMPVLTLFQDNDADEIMIRQEPSNTVETRYLDGSRVGEINFAYFTKSDDQQKAEEQLYNIQSVLDLSCLTEIARGTFVKIETVTDTLFVQKTEKNEYVFTSSFKLEYHKQK